MKTWVRSLALLSGLRIWHCHRCGVGHRRSLNLELLWLAFTALIQPLAWEFPYTSAAALKRPKTKKGRGALGHLGEQNIQLAFWVQIKDGFVHYINRPVKVVSLQKSRSCHYC